MTFLRNVAKILWTDIFVGHKPSSPAMLISGALSGHNIDKGSGGVWFKYNLITHIVGFRLSTRSVHKNFCQDCRLYQGPIQSESAAFLSYCIAYFVSLL